MKLGIKNFKIKNQSIIINKPQYISYLNTL